MNFSQLTHLYFADQGLDYRNITTISEEIRNNTVLTHIHLYNNPLGDRGVTALSAVLPNKGALVQLHLQSIQMTAGSVIPLALALSRLNNLEQLYLSNNFLGDEGAREICENLRSTQITHLGLHNVGMADVGALALANVIQREPNLNHLDIGGNPITDVGLIACAAAARVAGIRFRHLNLQVTNPAKAGIMAFFRD